MSIDERHLLKKAEEARRNAYAPYSKFAVGAAVLTSRGQIFTGSNVENAAYGLSVCAETCALLKAVSEGYKDIEAIAVIADTEGVCRPCGSCRQVIIEFGDEILIIMGNLKGEMETKKASEILPVSFSQNTKLL